MLLRQKPLNHQLLEHESGPAKWPDRGGMLGLTARLRNLLQIFCLGGETNRFLEYTTDNQSRTKQSLDAA